jgi:hypothetical protein
VTTITAAEFLALKASHKAKGGRAPHGRGIAHAGWREFGGIKHYYRSRAEMRFAAYLVYKQARGEIKSWQPEPETFWFSGIRRGTVSYLPDFRVVMPDDSIRYFEVKGWLDPRSRVTLKRMRQYHPTVSVTLIDKAWFKARGGSLSILVPGWEPT